MSDGGKQDYSLPTAVAAFASDNFVLKGQTGFKSFLIYLVTLKKIVKITV